MRAWIFLVLAGGCSLGCESVPALTFTTAPPADGGAEADGDCTSGLPPDAAIACCGSVPCSGECSAANCGACQAECDTPDTLCCAKLHNVVCRPVGSPCP